MTIAWIYLDKKLAAVDALKDYASMEYIINQYSDCLSEVKEDMIAVQSASVNGLPKQSNPHSGEARLAISLDEIDVLKERYRQALEYMEWFNSAWIQLDEEERCILSEFFTSDGSKSDAVGRIGKRLFIEKSQIYYRKDKALNHLVLLLYGK